MTDRETVSKTIRFPADWEQRIAAWADHHGSINAAVNAAVREAVLAFENEETTRVRVARIDANVEELNARFKYLESLGWAQLNALELNVGDSTKAWVEQQIDKVRG